MSDDLTVAASDLASVQDQISHLQEAESDLKERIRKLAGGVGSYPAGGLTVVVSPNRRFIPDLAAKVIPAEVLPLVTVPVINAAKVKALNEVTPRDWFADCFRDYEPIVKLR